MWKIQEARLKKHLTQEQLAELVGLSVSYVCEIENGRKNPSLKTLKKISSVLNIPLSSVFSEEPLSKNDASFCCPFIRLYRSAFESVAVTTSMALGSCIFKLPAEERQKLLNYARDLERIAEFEGRSGLNMSESSKAASV